MYKFFGLTISLCYISFTLTTDPKFNSYPVHRSFSVNNLERLHNDTIYYTIDPSFGNAEKEYIQERMNEIQSKTCIKWEPKPPIDRTEPGVQWVHFSNAEDPSSCRTERGVWSPATIFFPPHCFQDRWVLHEIGHALGMYHEHSRIDRDCYVEVNSHNQIDETFPYDKQSIMHYRRGEYLRPIAGALNEDEEFGRTDETLSELDAWKIKNRYCNEPHYCEKHPDECAQSKEFEDTQGCRNRSRSTD